MRTVIFAAPFALEATLRFALGASRLPGVRLVGVMQEPPQGSERHIFADIITVPNVLDPEQLIAGVEVARKRYGGLHRIIGVLEPLQTPLALARQHFGLPGTDPHTAELFRDKALMKDRLREAGIPVARHKLLHNEDDARAFAAEVGFPMVLKPPAGMGAKATFRVSDEGQLFGGVRGMRASQDNPVLAEEMLTGTEGSCDTVTIGGEPQVFSISHYLPTPLEVLENPWIQWMVHLPKDTDGEGYDDIKDLCRQVITTLGLKDGITHMEWFRRQDGSLAVGEIAQRPPGAQITRMIGLVHDIDPYRAWARAVIDGAFDGPWERKYSAGTAYLRGMGRGRVTSVTGLDQARPRSASTWSKRCCRRWARPRTTPTKVTAGPSCVTPTAPWSSTRSTSSCGRCASATADRSPAPQGRTHEHPLCDR
jgi:hypothetical protein